MPPEGKEQRGEAQSVHALEAQLIAMGFAPWAVRQVLSTSAALTIDQALDRLNAEASEHETATLASNVTSGLRGGRAASPSTMVVSDPETASGRKDIDAEDSRKRERPMSEEEQLQHAIQQSRVSAGANTDIIRASGVVRVEPQSIDLTMSDGATQQTRAHTTLSITDGGTNDDELQRAIAASLVDQQKDARNQLREATVPSDWPDAVGALDVALGDIKDRVRREGSATIGLRNIGNTCYLNSVLQVYYALRPFRRKVFAFRSKPVRSDSASAESLSRAAAVEVILALQRLFALMALSTSSFADPSEFTEKMRSIPGKTLLLGGQQDVTEFNQMLLDTVELGFQFDIGIEPTMSDDSYVQRSDQNRALGASQCAEIDNESMALETQSISMTRELGETSDSFIKQMFSVSFEQVLTDAHDDNLQLVSSHGETNALIVDATESVDESRSAQNTSLQSFDKVRGLYAALDEYVSTLIDYRHENCSEVRRARKRVWLTALPQALTINLQRVKFNRERSAAEKIHDAFDFPVELDTGLYLLRNRDKVMHLRAKLKESESYISALEKQLLEVDFGDLMQTLDVSMTQGFPEDEADEDARSVRQIKMMRESNGLPRVGVSIIPKPAAEPISACLARVVRVLELSREPSFLCAETGWLSGEKLDNCIDVLNALANNRANERSRLVAQLDQAQAARLAAFDSVETSTSEKYDLFAVLVHEGNPDSGHYWTYIKSGDEWLKCSDLLIETVPFEEMRKFSVGGIESRHASAYGLIYIRRNGLAESGQVVFSDDCTEAEEARRLLPMDVVQWVDEKNATFAAELADFERTKRAELVDQLTQDILTKAEDLLWETVRLSRNRPGVSTLNEFIVNARLVEELVYSTLEMSYLEIMLPRIAHVSSMNSSPCLSQDVLHALDASDYPAMGDFVDPNLGTDSGSDLEEASEMRVRLDTANRVVSQLSNRTERVAKIVRHDVTPEKVLSAQRNVAGFFRSSLEARRFLDRFEAAKVMHCVALRALVLTEIALEALLCGSSIAALTCIYSLGRQRYLPAGMSPLALSEVPGARDFILNRQHKDFWQILPVAVVCASDNALERIDNALMKSAFSPTDETIAEALLRGIADATRVAQIATALLETDNPALQIVRETWLRYIHCLPAGQTGSVTGVVRDKFATIQSMYNPSAALTGVLPDSLPSAELSDAISDVLQDSSSWDSEEIARLITSYDSHLSILEAMLHTETATRTELQDAAISLHQLVNSGTYGDIVVRFFDAEIVSASVEAPL